MRARALLSRLLLYPAVAASLLVFPAGLPWLALAWSAAFAACLLRGRPSRLLGGVALAVLLVKRPDLAPGLVAFLLALAAAVGAAPVLAGDRRRAAAASAALLLAWSGFAWNWHEAVRAGRRPELDLSRRVVCVGDSLTAWSYPRELGKRLNVPVLDHGVGGTTAAEGLAALDRSLELRPLAVLIEFGGHDYLRGRSREAVRADLDAMIRRCREAGAEPVLFEIPRGFLCDGFGGLERGLAREHDLELIPDGAIRRLVLQSPWFPVRLGEPLSDDGLHPNAAGSAHLADHAAAALARVFGPGILKVSRTKPLGS